MNIEAIIVIAYIVIGAILMSYWFKRDYLEEYEKAVSEHIEEKGMVNILLLVMWTVWPIFLIKNLIIYKTI